MRKENWKKCTAFVLTAALVLTQLPAVAMAENNVPEDGSIASFEPLDSDVKDQTVPVGTAYEDLNLPDTVTATIYHVTQDTGIPDKVNGGEAGKEVILGYEDDTAGESNNPSTASPSDADESVPDNAAGDSSETDSEKPVTTVTTSKEEIPVTWDSSPAYDGDTEGKYVFTADLGGYPLSRGVKPPRITVTVTDDGSGTPTLPGEIRPETTVEEIDLMSLSPEELDAIQGYDLNDVAIINNIIEDTGMAYQTNRPDQWDFVVWKEKDNVKRATELQLSNKGMTGALDITGLTELVVLDCSHNQLTALIGFDIPNMHVFNCSYNLLERIDVEAADSIVGPLDLSHNNFTELDQPLGSCQYVDLGINVSDNPHLRKLRLDMRTKTTLDMSDNPELTEADYDWSISGIYCDNTQLTEIGISVAPKSLSTTGAPISRINFYDKSLDRVYIDYFHHTAGGTMDIKNSGFSGIMLTAFPDQGYTFQKWIGLPSALEESAADISVHIPNESMYPLEITAVFSPEEEDSDGDTYYDGDVAVFQAFLAQHPELNVNSDSPADWAAAGLVEWDSKLPQRIGRLNLNGKSLTGSLDLSGLSGLTELSCKDNSLTGLNLSSLPGLKRLDCGNNQLTTLNMSGLPALQSLTCDGNPIRELDLSQLPGLNALFCAGNSFERLTTQGGELTISQREGGTVTAASFSPLTGRITLTAGDPDSEHTFDGWWADGVTLPDTSANPVSFIIAGDIGLTPLYTPKDSAAGIELAKNEIMAADYTVKQETANEQDALRTWLIGKINSLPGMKVADITVGSGDVAMTEGSFQAAVQGDIQHPQGTDGSFRFQVTLQKGGQSETTDELSGTITATPYVKSADQQAVEAAAGIISAASYTVDQDTANTQAAVKGWLTDTINAAAGMDGTGITVSADDITFTSGGFRPAVAGDSSQPGINGSFRFTVHLAKGQAQATAGPKDGTITASVYTGKTDLELVTEAKEAFENSGAALYTIGQERANTAEALKDWLAGMIEGLPGVHGTGIAITAADITLTDFRPATEGNAAAPAGTDGSFRFTVSFHKGNETLVSGERSGTITARAYAVQDDQQAVDVAKAVIENSAAAYTVRQTTANTPSEVRTWLVETVNALPGIGAAGITLTDGDITMIQADFHPAIEGDAGNPAGTDGGFRFTAALHKGGASAVTDMTGGVITAAPYTGQSDRQSVDAAKAAIENSGPSIFTADQASANTEDDVKAWLAGRINDLPGMNMAGIPVSAADIAIAPGTFHAAVTGTPENPAGTNGSFHFTVSLAKGSINDRTGEISGSIAAARYSGGSGGSPGGSGGSSGGSGGSSGGSTGGGGSASRSAGVTSTDAKKGKVNSLTGIITGTGDGYSSWNQDDIGWKLRYADGSFASGTMAAAADGSAYEQPAWEMVNGAWYAFGTDGYAKNGFVSDPALGGYFYIDINTGMKTGWQLIDGKWRYFNPISDGKKGIMLQDAWIDGGYVDKNGVWNPQANESAGS